MAKIENVKSGGLNETDRLDVERLIERYEEELGIVYKMADDMALTGNVPDSKEHAEAIQNYLDWVEAGQMVVEVEDA